MAVQSSKAVEPKKRKIPPTFRHLPKNRAQKLKKSWVEKKKLKTRWKAQKLKEGLDSGWPKRAGPLGEAGRENNVEDHRTQEEASDDEISDKHTVGAGPSDLERPALPHRKAQTSVSQVDESQHNGSINSSSRSKGKRPASAFDEEDTINSDREDGKPTLRELTRQAYSPSSLHTFKADPLRRRKGAVTSSRPVHSESGLSKNSGTKAEVNDIRRTSDPNHGRRSGQDNRGHAAARGGRPSGQPRGQPNMKLRMEAMLERIKRDYS